MLVENYTACSQRSFQQVCCVNTALEGLIQALLRLGSTALSFLGQWYFNPVSAKAGVYYVTSVCWFSSLAHQQVSSPEPEDGIIPDSPLQHISLPVVSKMRRRKETHHVRYAEKPLSQSQSPALNGLS